MTIPLDDLLKRVERLEGKAREQKDLWDKLKVLSAAAVPILVVIFGFVLNATLKSKELKVEYVKVAMQILQNPDTTGTVGMLRQWAVPIIDNLGPERLTPELRDALTKGRVTFPAEGGSLRELGQVLVTSRGIKSLRIAIDGKYVGMTPDSVVLPVGNHLFEWRSSTGQVICSSFERIWSAVRLRIACEPGSKTLVTTNRDVPAP